MNDWVLVLKGAARLAFEDGSKVSMGPGDSLEIPAHVKHKVVWTDPEEETVRVAVHYASMDTNLGPKIDAEKTHQIQRDKNTIAEN